MPGSDVPQGVLPRLIATLVNRRKQVKSLMKDKAAGQVKMLQVCTRNFSFSCWLTHHLSSVIVGYQAKGSEVDGQLDVRLSGFRRFSFLRQTIGRIDYLQGSRDFDTDQGACGRTFSGRKSRRQTARLAY